MMGGITAFLTSPAVSLTFAILMIVALIVNGPPKNNVPLCCVIYVSIAVNLYAGVTMLFGAR